VQPGSPVDVVRVSGASTPELSRVRSAGNKIPLRGNPTPSLKRLEIATNVGSGPEATRVRFHPAGLDLGLCVGNDSCIADCDCGERSKSTSCPLYVFVVPARR
jgi:hypothetical protein